MKTFLTCLVLVWATAVAASPPMPFVPPIPKQETPELQRELEIERDAAYRAAVDVIPKINPGVDVERVDPIAYQVMIAENIRNNEIVHYMLRRGALSERYLKHCDDKCLKAALDSLSASVTEKQFSTRADDFIRVHISQYYLYGIYPYKYYFPEPPVFVRARLVKSDGAPRDPPNLFRYAHTQDKKRVGILWTVDPPKGHEQLVPGLFFGNRDELATHVTDLESQVRVLHLSLINSGQIKDAPPPVK